MLIGDVWLCSGQSNMEMAVRQVQNAGGEMAQSANDSLRLFQVGHHTSAAPLDHFFIPVAWDVASPQTVGPFSAACYFFARDLQKTVKVPMGLIHASWGGSAIEPWISADGLRTIGGFEDRLQLLDAYARDPKAATERLGHAWEAWWRSKGLSPQGQEPWQPAATAGWHAAPAALGDWKQWGVPELASFDGMLWYRTTVTLSGAQAAGAATLSLGGIDEVDETWVNGQPVGNTFGWGAERNYDVPPGLLHEGRKRHRRQRAQHVGERWPARAGGQDAAAHGRHVGGTDWRQVGVPDRAGERGPASAGALGDGQRPVDDIQRDDRAARSGRAARRGVVPG